MRCSWCDSDSVSRMNAGPAGQWRRATRSVGTASAARDCARPNKPFPTASRDWVLLWGRCVHTGQSWPPNRARPDRLVAWAEARHKFPLYSSRLWVRDVLHTTTGQHRPESVLGALSRWPGTVRASAGWRRAFAPFMLNTWNTTSYVCVTYNIVCYIACMMSSVRYTEYRRTTLYVHIEFFHEIVR